MSSSSRSSTAYSRVDEPFLASEKEREAYSSDSEHGPYASKRGSRWMNSSRPWIISTVVFAMTTLAFLVNLFTARLMCVPQSGIGTFEGGYDTDLEAAKPYIRSKKVRFTGSVAFHDNGTLYRVYNDDEPKYTGYPDAEIDKAWEDLMYGAAVDLPPELAGDMKDMTWEEPQGGLYRTGLEVFHQLHCLDYIRKALYPEYYGREDIPRLFDSHLEHCIDYVRQALMCAADSTPVRLEWRKESHFLIPKFDMWHTCRDFDQLKSFAKEHALEIYNKQNQKLIDKLIEEGTL